MSDQSKKFYFVVGLALFIWLIIFYQGLITAIDVWIVSEIFNHCLFVIPFCLYLIYQKRKDINSSNLQPSLLPLLPLIGTIFVQLFALIGDIKILMHIATFTSLPLLIWLLVGNKVAKKLSFPLFFILFCIPIGDQLIPYLQELTTNLAVPLLEFTNVPIYRNGLYLDIPEGRFLVAEACSGISFLISSIVFGFGYAYLSFTSLKKRALFVSISILVPVLANALRVYGIILTGHLSNMEYAVGADHLIYGGVFYIIVLFILIFIGERYRDKKQKTVVIDTHSEKTSTMPNYSVLAITCFIVFAIGQQFWLYNISNADKPKMLIPSNVSASQLPYQAYENTAWLPQFKEADKETFGIVETPTTKVKIETYIAYYSGIGGELISASHRLFGDQQWSLVEHQNIIINKHNVTLTELASQFNQRRYLLHWYEINGKHFNSSTKAKLYQAYLMLLGKNASGVKIILSINKEQLAKDAFIGNVQVAFPELRNTIYYGLTGL